MHRAALIALALLTISHIAAQEVTEPQPFYDDASSKWGFCREGKKYDHYDRHLLRDREVLLPAKYVSVKPFWNGLAAVTLEGSRPKPYGSTTGGKWGFIDVKGTLVIPLKYEGVGSIDGKLISVKMNGQWGFIDGDDKIVVPLKYDRVGFMRDDLLKVKKDEKWGVLGKDGSEILPLRYAYVSGPHDGLITAWDGTKYGFFDPTGRAITEMIYDRVDILFEGRARVRRGNERGWIDALGKEIAMGKFDAIARFRNGRAIVWKNKLCGWAGLDGAVLVEPAWQYLKADYLGLAAAQRDGLWGYIDLQGRIVIQPQFKYAGEFHSNGLACVKLNQEGPDQFAFINREGRFAFDHRFQRDASFDSRDNTAIVRIKDKWFKLALDGTLAETLVYSSVAPFGPETEGDENYEPLGVSFLRHNFDNDR